MTDAATRSAGRERRRRPSAGELADVLVAQGALLAALLRARLTPTGRLVAPLGEARPAGAPATSATVAPPSAGEGDGHPEADERRAVVDRVARAVDRAARRGLFRPTCLVRSLALAELLRRHGVEGAHIRIGVRRPAVGATGRVAARGGGVAAGGMSAHAWVELDGAVVGDDPRHVATFTPVGRVTASRA